MSKDLRIDCEVIFNEYKIINIMKNYMEVKFYFKFGNRIITFNLHHVMKLKKFFYRLILLF